MKVINQTAADFKIIDFTWPAGFYADGIHAGLRKQKLDMGWLYSSVPATAAGVYTTNQFQAAPTQVTKKMIQTHHQLQALVLNSAIANSCTGALGLKNAQTTQQLAADVLEIDPELVGVASTGLIGAQLPMPKIAAGLQKLQLTKNDKLPEAILTTDTKAKTISVALKLNGQVVTISGFCKGSGMIHPNMCTMLGFITTDANIEAEALQTLLSEDTESTFNQITVDGDTSTNDMVVALANGLADNTMIETDTKDYQKFGAAFHYIMAYLAKHIAADGEGATKLIEVNVNHSASTEEAQAVAKTIVGSNLVKSAIFGHDPNWGRIIAAIGQTKAVVDVAHVSVWLNGLPLIVDSVAADTEVAVLEKAMDTNQIQIDVDLNAGPAKGQAWGCDLTYNYVKINASYHT
ncbi:bifunctional glutamate N-acetyltransferase/amino-acid acetyltransferase ArgJ [Agrilactobacillus yilanensis]|uniref:Arginine biosynthesis bifunctional protein ArgJ n=1 Tax=Agrilactobacillus yilanensis TaxID=2485997 RepID=A0ABW4J6E4_9LACO|nr:bifunctional glutamate N-acetyltransferase/amino-acid acetyltransferase ArgJ [Agrilactobacillus yilanensis]